MHDSDEHTHQSHAHSLREELLCHLPYATFSVAIGFVILSVIHFFGISANSNPKALAGAYRLLFHSFHYLHIVFAVTGTVVTFFRFSQNFLVGVLVSLISPAIFCTISDVALPSIAGNILGIYTPMHVCFFEWHDCMNVFPFMIVGLITGLALRKHHEVSLGFFSLASHFIHILISSLASLFYVVSWGFNKWPSVMGLLFVFLIIAVVIPCTISDIIVPSYFARFKKKKLDEKCSSGKCH